MNVIDDFSYMFESGKIYGIIGASGSGKSTLLNMIGKLDNPTEGKIVYYYNDEIDKRSKTLLYRNRISYLFQNYALIDNKTVKQNLDIAFEYMKIKNKDEVMEKALEKVGLHNCLNMKIFTLSGGEQQRVALARILLRNNDIILADEPTGNLDHLNARIIFNIFEELKQQGKTIIIATHDMGFLDICDKKIELKK